MGKKSRERTSKKALTSRARKIKSIGASNVGPVWRVDSSWCKNVISEAIIDTYRLVVPVCSKLMNQTHGQDCSGCATCIGHILWSGTSSKKAQSGGGVPTSSSGKEYEAFIDRNLQRPLGDNPLVAAPAGKTVSTGLANLGNTCYANAVFQTLFANTSLRLAVMNEYSREGLEAAVQELATLFGKMQQCSYTQSPSALLKSLQVSTDEQQDVHEFVRLMMSFLDRASPAVGKVMKDMYQGTIKHERTCDECGTTSRRAEQVMDFLLQIGSLKTLEQSFELLQMEEKLTGQNRLECSRCNAMREGTTRTQIHSVPQVMFVQLVRFLFDEKTFNRRKVTDKYSFPLIYEVPGMRKKYRLQAVLLHKGNTPHSGHYVVHVLERDSTWIEYNDETVTDVTKDYEKPKRGGAFGRVESEEAYVLVYVEAEAGAIINIECDPPIKLQVEIQTEASTHAAQWEHYTSERKQLEDAITRHNEAREFLKRNGRINSMDAQHCYAVRRDYLAAWAKGGFLRHQERAMVSEDDEENEKKVIIGRHEAAEGLKCPHGKLVTPDPTNDKLPYKIVSRPVMEALGLLRGRKGPLSDPEGGGGAPTQEEVEEEDDEEEDTSDPEDALYPLRTVAMFCSECSAKVKGDEERCQMVQENHKMMVEIAQQAEGEDQSKMFWVEGAFFDRWKKSKENIQGDATAALLCPHQEGGLKVDVHQKGRKVPALVWEYMSHTLTGPPLPVSAHSICSLCQNETDTVRLAQQDAKAIRISEGSHLSSLVGVRLFDNNKRVSSSTLASEAKRYKDKYKGHEGTIPNLERIFYAIDMEWVNQWRTWYEGGTEAPPRIIDHDKFVCRHHATVLGLEDLKVSTTRGSQKPKMALVTPEEYEYLKKHYSPSYNFSYSEVNENRHLHPQTCESCREEYLRIFKRGSVTFKGQVTLSTQSRRPKKVDINHVVSDIGCDTILGELKKQHLVAYFLEAHHVLVDYRCISFEGLGDSEATDARSLFECGILDGAVITVSVNGGITEVGESQGSAVPRGPEHGFRQSRLEGCEIPFLGGAGESTDVWACSACTFENPLSRTRCEICNEPKAKRK